MPKFFVTQDKITENQIIIDTEDVAHISRVLRLGIGDHVTVCDSHGTDYEAEIAEMEQKQIVCSITEKRASESEPNIKVTLFQGLPKASKMEYIIQKTTELGISEIVPVKLSRCVVKIDNKKDERKKLDRWQKISEAAAKQSGRGIVPQISEIMTLDEVIKRSKEFDLFFVPYECEEQKTLKEVLLSRSDIKTVGFIIGPEGGFDPAETEKLRENGIDTVTLGKRILRTETAGEAVLAMTMYEIGDINNQTE
ncbi:MAG: 16S rRNA (uracil(1498)-N(3))-methyltransferase [Clostridia bacterium]|nr:16S rRNA (uracil(1498)-N(3))-methyltransferase [Clostridia bacterium]